MQAEEKASWAMKPDTPLASKTDSQQQFDLNIQVAPSTKTIASINGQHRDAGEGDVL